MLLIVYVLGIERGVVEQNLDAVGARFFQASDGPVIQQVGQAAGSIGVISSFFVGEQQAGIFGAAFGGGQSPLRVEQDGAGMLGQALP